MNIISNNCCGADIYTNVLKTEFSNPFIWSLLFPNDFIYLYENYDSINFKNIDLAIMKAEDDIGTKKHKIDKKIIGIRIDNKITAWFTHILYDAKFKEPIKIGDDRYYYRNFELVFNNYKRRLSRMVEKPIFTVLAYQNVCWTKEKIDKLKSKYPIFIITDIPNCKESENKYIQYVEKLCGHPWYDFSKYIENWKNFVKLKMYNS